MLRVRYVNINKPLLYLQKVAKHFTSVINVKEQFKQRKAVVYSVIMETENAPLQKHTKRQLYEIKLV